MKTQATKVYDEKFIPDSNISVTGVFLVVVPVLFTAFCILNHVQYYGSEVFLPIMIVGGLVWRLIAGTWIHGIAKDLNRNPMLWVAFAFLLPGIALLVIGQKKKIKDPYAYRQYLYQNDKETAPVSSRIYTHERSLQWAS